MEVIQQNKKMTSILLILSVAICVFGYNEYTSLNDNYWLVFHIIRISNKHFGLFLMLLFPICLFFCIQVNTTKKLIIIDKDAIITTKGQKILFSEIDNVIIISINFAKMGVKIILKNRGKYVFISWKILGCGVSQFANLVNSKINNT